MMLVFDAKLEQTKQQYQLLDRAIKTDRFVRNDCLKYWMDNQDIGQVRIKCLLCCTRCR